MQMFSFTFKDLNSFDDFGIIVTKKPNIPIPQRNVEYIKVPGRNGSLAIDEGTYDNIIIAIDCGFKDKSFVEKIDEIKAWLSGKEDKLIFSNDEEKYYPAQVVNSYDIIPSIKNLAQFTVAFNCQPYKMSLNNGKKTITNSTSISNPGSLYSEPSLKVYGSGNLSVTVNSDTFSILDVIDYVTIDSTLKDCYKDNQPVNNKMNGDFPIFKTGKNQISWIGNVEKIDIIPNWRWL